MTTPSPADPAWELFANGKAFDSQRTNPAVQGVLTLARIVNSVRFCLTVVNEAAGGVDSRTVRQRSSALFYLGALVYEAIDDVAALERILSHYPTYAALKEILDEAETTQLKTGLLYRLRNKAVFHFDAAVIPEGLRNITGLDVVFASGNGLQRIESYYDLADITVMYFVLESPSTIQEFESLAADALLRIAKLGSRIANASDEIIREVLRAFGWQIRRPAA